MLLCTHITYIGKNWTRSFETTDHWRLLFPYSYLPRSPTFTSFLLRERAAAGSSVKRSATLICLDDHMLCCIVSSHSTVSSQQSAVCCLSVCQQVLVGAKNTNCLSVCCLLSAVCCLSVCQSVSLSSRVM